MSYIWPLALVVVSNIIYQICTKAVPEGMHPLASLTVTYLVGAVASAVLYFLLNRSGNLLAEYRHVNWAPILLGIVIVAWLGQSTLNLVIAIAVGMVAPLASNSRAAVLTVRNAEYVESARSIGLSEWRIVMVHILPNCLSTILVQVTLRVAGAIISASSLSFLGLGVPVPSPEWGALLSAGRAYIRDASYLTMFPGLAIMILVLSLNLLGDGLRDAMDPKLRK